MKRLLGIGIAGTALLCLATSSLAAAGKCNGGGSGSSPTAGGTAAATAGNMVSARAVAAMMQSGGGGCMGRPSPRSQTQTATTTNPSVAPTVDQLVQQALLSDKNGDGKLSKSEVPSRLLSVFDKYDTNGDGFLDATELAVAAGDYLAEGKLTGSKNKTAGKLAAK